MLARVESTVDANQDVCMPRSTADKTLWLEGIIPIAHLSKRCARNTMHTMWIRE